MPGVIDLHDERLEPFLNDPAAVWDTGVVLARPLVATAVLLASALLGACGDDDDAAAPSSSTTARSTTSVTSTSPPTSTAPPTTPTSPAPTTVPATRGPEATTAGTVPGTDLRDGTHWGYVNAVEGGPPVVLSIDVAEVYFDAEAVAEAAEDSVTLDTEVDPVMYVRNDNPASRDLAVAPGAAALVDGCWYGTGQPGAPCDDARPVDPADVPTVRDEAAARLVIFVLQGGRITRIEAPYFP
jgi:hypothetical protein